MAHSKSRHKAAQQTPRSPATTKTAPGPQPVTVRETRTTTTLADQKAVSERQLHLVVSRYALRGALTAALLGTLIAFGVNWTRSPVPLVGDLRAFGPLAIFIGAAFTLVSAGIAYAMGLRFRNARVPADRRHSWWIGVAPVAIGAAVETLLLIGIAVLLGNLVFKELVLINPFASLIIGAVAAVAVYFCMTHLLLASDRSILQILVALLFLGLLVAAAGAQNAQWWKESFSYLGTSDSNTHLVFNVCFVLTGLLIIVWQAFFSENITILVDHGAVKPRVHAIFKYGLIIVGIMIMLIGVLHWGASPLISALHDLSAYGAGAIITLGMLSLYWLIPGLSREFLITSVVLAVLVIGAVVMLFLDLFNTVGVELVYFVIAGVWLILLTDNSEMLVSEVEQG